MRRLSVMAAVFALAFAMMPTATAHRAMLKAETGGFGFPTHDPGAIAERCPEGWDGWIYNTIVLGGEIKTPVFQGPIEANPMGEPPVPDGTHCSRWVKGPPMEPNKWYPGRVVDGRLAIATADGDLVVRYSGFFRFKGDLTVEPLPEYVSKIWLFYRVDGAESTGVFEDASGFGVMKVTDKIESQVPSFAAKMKGPIQLQD